MAKQVCPVCKGEGLVGVGDFPHLKQGPISTCTYCTGTGKIEVEDSSKSAE